MARQRGSVNPTKDGRYRARYSAGVDPVTGDRIQRMKTFDDRKSAQQWLTAELHRLDSGERQRRLSKGPALGEFLRDFYLNVGTGRKKGDKVRLSPKTLEIDLDLVDRYVIRRAPTLASLPLTRLTEGAIQRLLTALAQGDVEHRPLAKATVSRVARILRARLRQAVEDGKLRANPISDLRKFLIEGTASRAKRTLAAEQARALLDVYPQDRYGVCFALITWTGCRPGEAAGLRWEDVDLDRRVLTIRHALVRTRGAWALRGTKTDKSRTVAIPEELSAQLATHRRQQAEERLLAGPEYQDNGLVFCTRFGLPVHMDLLAARHFKPLLPLAAARLLGRSIPEMPTASRSAIYREASERFVEWTRDVMRDARFPSVSLYELRHTQATVLNDLGVPTNIIADRLGHGPEVTTKHYTHKTTSAESAALRLLEGAFGKERQA